MMRTAMMRTMMMGTMRMMSTITIIHDDGDAYLHHHADDHDDAYRHYDTDDDVHDGY